VVGCACAALGFFVTGLILTDGLSPKMLGNSPPSFA